MWRGQARALSEMATGPGVRGPARGVAADLPGGGSSWARRAEDTRLQAALQLRLADTLDRLGDPAAARLHRQAAERLLDDDRWTRDPTTGTGR